MELKNFINERNRMNSELPNNVCIGRLRNGDKLPDPANPQASEIWLEIINGYKEYPESMIENRVNLIFYKSWIDFILDNVEFIRDGYDLSLMNWEIDFEAVYKNCFKIYQLAETVSTSSDFEAICCYAKQIENACATTAYGNFAKSLCDGAKKMASVQLALCNLTEITEEAKAHMLIDALSF